MQSLGIAGMSKSEVSQLCAVLDGQVQAFLTRRLDAEYPYVYLDARYEHVQEGWAGAVHGGTDRLRYQKRRGERGVGPGGDGQ